MSDPADGWDDDERQVVSELQADLDTIRRRHAGDPPPDVLRAARAGALPREMQSKIEAHLASSRWSRALVEGIESVPAEDLDEVTEARILKRLKAQTGSASAGRRLISPVALGGLAAAASIVLAVYLMRPQPLESPVTGEPPIAAPAAAAPAPVVLAFTKPEVRLSTAALTWRSGATGGDFLTDLEPAIELYRIGDYAKANQAFASLAARYPSSFDVLYYQGLSRMLSDDFPGAVTSLSAAATLSDPLFAGEVEWFLAVAEHRAGQIAPATGRLGRLCQGGSGRAADACDALKRVADSPQR